MTTRWRFVVMQFGFLAASALALQAAPAEAQWRCPPGYFRNRWGRCVRGGGGYVAPRACPPGYVLDGRGVCTRAVIAPQPRMCPPGYFYFRGRCVHR